MRTVDFDHRMFSADFLRIFTIMLKLRYHLHTQGVEDKIQGSGQQSCVIPGSLYGVGLSTCCYSIGEKESIVFEI